MLGVPGCNNWQPQCFPKLRDQGVKLLEIGLDNDVDAADNPGRVWAGLLAQYLEDIGMAYHVAMPQAGDMNDLLRARRTVAIDRVAS